MPIEGAQADTAFQKDAGITVVLTDVTEEKLNVEEQIENERVTR